MSAQVVELMRMEELAGRQGQYVQLQAPLWCFGSAAVVTHTHSMNGGLLPPGWIASESLG